MTTIVRYSCDWNAQKPLSEYWFVYELDNSNIGVTTINRIRTFIEKYYNLSQISKWIILGLLNESNWYIAWEWIDTNWNLCTLVFVNVELFKYRLEVALSENEIIY